VSPSLLARSGPSKRALMEEAAVARVRAGPPWTGYLPDTNAQLLKSNAIVSSSNLVPRNEVLTYDDGWSKYQHASTNPVPLGGAGWAFPGTTGFQIQALHYLPPNPNSLVEGVIAITADNGATDGTVFEFLTNGAGTWTLCTAATTTIPTGNEVMIDHAYYPLASIASRQGIVVFCNGTLAGANSFVWYYPSAGSTYDVFPMPTATPNLTNFKAASVACAHERLFFLNTSENASAKPQRLRWSKVGWTTVAATNFDASSAGAGASDMTYFKGRGVKVLPIGDKLACYFEDGVALVRWTGNVTAPLTIDYANRNRGLLGVRAVVDLGGGVHFGAFTDGFFFLNARGEWNEAGTEVQAGTRVRKFTDYFFSNVSRKNEHRIVMHYDEKNHWVRISWPDTGQLVSGLPDNEWVYELGADRMWPQIATLTGLSNGTNAYPTAYATVKNVAGNDMQVIHGTTTGHVYAHVASTHLRDGTAPAFALSTIYHDVDDPFTTKAFLGHHVEMRDHGASGSLAFSTNDSRLNTALAQCTHSAFAYAASNAHRKMLWVPCYGTAHAFQHNVSGTHPVSLHGFGQTYARGGDVL
jgi:hypothetical protein